MIHRLGDAYRSAVSAVTPQSAESKFLKEGKLTPEEFLEAGNQLAFKFPSWEWAKGQPAQRAAYLPEDKQYLITRRVPCKDRVRALDYVLEHKTRTEDDWLLPETADEGRDAGGGELKDIDDLTGASGGAGGEGAGPLIVAQEDFLGGGGGGGLPDFSDLDGALAESDPAAGGAAGGYLVADAPDETVMKMRRYDLSITYDKYYQTPRLWLFGYDENDVPLKPVQVYEDILSDYVAKTVTIDPHPLEVTPTVSIHPCKHSLVMKKVVDDWAQQGITPRHDLAIFVFLKMISGIVPTINYDFTMDIEF